MDLPPRLKHLAALIPRKPSRPSLHVYVIQCNEFLKVGVASDVRARLAYLQTGCPYRLLLLGSWRSPSAIADEEAIHAYLEPYRERGEWFRLPKRIMDEIALKLPAYELASRLLPSARMTMIRNDLLSLNS